ncbi:CapA family protein [Alkalibacterium psychrotolerans]
MKPVNNRKNSIMKWVALIIGFAIILVAATAFAINLAQNDSESANGVDSEENGQTAETDNGEEINEDDSAEGEDTADDSEVVEEEEEETFIDIRLSAVGDVMGHGAQLESAYDAETDTYDFTSVFEDIRPHIEGADIAIANLETTLAGDSRPYIGYPLFNTPDAIVDALDYAGFDTVITTNNHSLDTRAEGLRRTVEVIEEKGLDPVGTFSEAPESHVFYKDVNGIKIAILAYTEHLNGLEAQYSDQELNDMVNMISEERILADIEEAREADVDIMVSYLHWGQEYQREPNEYQRHYAELLTREGVDIILGSHPHVIQPTEFLEVDGNESFVAYSLGNFVSNQRRETLGEAMAPTEDGVVMHIDIQKNEQTGETTVQNVDYTATWVYRNRHEGNQNYTYRILPVEDHMENEEFSEDFRNRMRNSYQETTDRLNMEQSDND